MQRDTRQKIAAKAAREAPQRAPQDILRLIVKIQSVFRGVLTRRWVQHVYGFSVRDRNLVTYYQAPNYDNQLVQSIKQELGSFNFTPAP